MFTMKISECRAKILSRGWLSETSADFSSALLGIATWHSFPAGHPLALAGGDDGDLRGIATGWVNCTTTLGPADGGLIHVAGAGDWFGETPIISGRARSLTCVAQTATEIAQVRQSSLQRLLAAQPVFWKAVAQLALINSQVAGNIAADLTVRSSRRRCVAALLRLAGCRFGDLPLNTKISPVTQDELGGVDKLVDARLGG